MIDNGFCVYEWRTPVNVWICCASTCLFDGCVVENSLQLKLWFIYLFDAAFRGKRTRIESVGKSNFDEPTAHTIACAERIDPLISLSRIDAWIFETCYGCRYDNIGPLHLLRSPHPIFMKNHSLWVYKWERSFVIAGIVIVVSRPTNIFVATVFIIKFLHD